MLVNGIECLTGKFGEIDSNEYDAVALLLCKECIPALPKLGLSENILKTVQLYIQQSDEQCECGSIHKLSAVEGDKLRHIFIAGCGKGKECTPNNFRKAAGNLVREIKKVKCTKAAIYAPIFLNTDKGHYLQAAAEGLLLGAYEFTEFKSDSKKAVNCSICIPCNSSDAKDIIVKAEIIAESVSFARNLINRPGNVVTPYVMAQEASAIAENDNLKLEVLDEALLTVNKMNAILAVGQGSKNKPCLISLKYQGAGEDVPYTAYVGKGITFDSGGISIKPDDNMGEMKDDMSGAAAVLGAIKAIAELKLPCNIMAVLACAENMPGGKAQRPGDIVTAANGKTIEVISTDAEGRMVLADAVWYACQNGAAKVIDIATLTGAVIIALGKETSAIVANNDDLAEKIKESGRLTGESYWQLPSLPECKEAIKSDVADLLNSAGRPGGCITGGLFVGEFIKDGVQWAHIDIGGTSTADKTAGFKVKGGTGFGTMTLINLAGRL